jgi:hypothetical protein
MELGLHSIVTGYGMDDKGLIPERAGIVLFVTTSSSTLGPLSSLSGEYQVPRLRMCGAIPLLSHTPLCCNA